MISLVILDGKTEELKALEGCFRNLVARNSDEMLERSFFQNGKKLLAGLGNIDPVHMAVMDVTIPDGVEAAQQVRSLQPASEIMIVADMSVSPMQYMTPAIRAASLLLRPFSGEQLRTVCGDFFENCRKELFGDRTEKNFLVENSDGKTMLPYSSIFYFEAREKKIFVRTKTAEYGIYDTIDRLQQDLPEEFVRCHRGFVINSALIEKVKLSENLIYMKNDILVPLSRSYKSAIKELLHGKDSD